MGIKKMRKKKKMEKIIKNENKKKDKFQQVSKELKGLRKKEN